MTRTATLKQIPQVPLSNNPALNDFLGAVKQCLEVYQGNIGDGSDVIPRKELPDFENQNADWDSTDGGDEVYNKPTLGTAASRDAEDVLTDSAKLPDGHAVIAYGKANWGTGEIDNFRIGDETIEGSLWNIIGLDNDNASNFTIYDLVNGMPWISAYRHGGVFLYFDGNRRLETTISGVTITGDLSVSGGWSIDDFLIGTYTLEANPWNAIKVNGERNFVIWNDQEDEPFLSCYRNAGVFLYYNGVRILETASEGIKLSNSDQSIVATIGPQTIEAATWQGFNIAGGANFCVYDADNTNSMIGAYRNAGVFLYYVGDKKIETTTNGVEVTGYADLTNLSVTTRVGPQTLDAATWHAISVASANFSVYDLDNTNAMIGAYRAAGVFLYYNGVKKFETTSTGVEISGQVKITGGTPGLNKVLTSNAVGLATWETPGSCSCDDIDIGTFTIDAASWNALKIGGTRNFTLYNDQEGEAFLSCYRNAGVLIYYNGVNKFETTSAGATITGQIKITGGVPGANKVLTSDAAGLATWAATGSGDVVGPGSATDNAICRFNSTTGKIIQNSSVIISDSGVINFGDGEVIKIGASDDMRLGNYYVGGGTFNSITLYGSDNFSIYDSTNSNAMIGAYRNAGVFLYYSGVAKIETTNIGVTVTGTVTASCGVLTCDYVFEEGYDLMPLDVLGEYVKTKKALPDMTINKGGIFDSATLRQETVEKIEEQSLYILQLHERVKALENKRGN